MGLVSESPNGGYIDHGCSKSQNVGAVSKLARVKVSTARTSYDHEPWQRDTPNGGGALVRESAADYGRKLKIKWTSSAIGPCVLV